MKFRTDFVTNSSSSSFIIEIDVFLKNGRKISLLNPENISDKYENLIGYSENMVENFTPSPEDFFECEDIDDLIQLIEEGIELEMYFNEEDDEEDSLGINTRKEQIERFTDKIYELDDISRIKSIEVRSQYFACGEFCGCIIENDEKLQELASAYLDDDSDENEEKLLEYINDANNPSEYSDEDDEIYFAENVESFRYSYWNGDIESNLKEVAKDILDAAGPEIGTEYLIINFVTGDYESYAELEIQ